MSAERHVALFNMEPESGPGLRATINGLPHTKVVLEAASGLELAESLRRTSVSLVVVHLDPLPETILQMIEHVAAQFPEVPIVGISENTDPQIIISAMRAGCRQFVMEPLDRADFSVAIDRVTVKHESAAPHGRRICVIGASGGVGVTTICCNLAMEMAELSASKAAVLDLQLEFGDVANTFDCEPEHSIAELCDADRDIDSELLDAVMVHLPCNVSVLARPANMEQAGLVLPDRVVSVLRMLSARYPNVVLDVPRELNRLTLSVLEVSDVVLIVTQLMVPSVRNATRLHKTLLSYGMPEERMRIVINRYRKNVGQISPQDVEKHFKNGIFATVPNDYHCVASSLDFGHPLMTAAPESPVRTAIRDIAQKLDGGDSTGNAVAVSARKGKLLSRIFGS